MVQLYIFDKNLVFKGILEDFFSLMWIRRYSKHGEFEIHCNFDTGMINLLQKDDIVWKSDDREAGYISYRQLTQDSEGKEVLVLRGRFLTHYADRRIVWGRKSITNKVELIMRELLNENLINPVNIDRKIDKFVLGELNNFEENISYQASYKNVLEEIEDLALTNNYGIRSVLDLGNKETVFETYKGLDRTVGNGVNAPAMFSKEFDNILEQEYMDSIGDYRNIALVAGEGEGIDRKVEVIGQAIGLERQELYVDARDLQSTNFEGEVEVTISEVEYRDMLKNRGYKKLSETKKIEVFNSRVDLDSNLEYKKDFDLGDIVTFTSKEWGITIDTRVAEIEEVYEEEGKSVFIVFGDEMPDIIDKIKREVR